MCSSGHNNNSNNNNNNNNITCSKIKKGKDTVEKK